MGTSWEPGGNAGQVITPELYAQCFAKARKAIKAVPGHADGWVVLSAPAPCNIQTQNPADPSGDLAKYFGDFLNQCIQPGQKPDGLAIHADTHGMVVNLITSDDKEGNPAYGTRHHHFRTFLDFLSVVPAALKSAPVVITECQPADPSWRPNRNIGGVRAVYKENNDWNATRRINRTTQAGATLHSNRLVSVCN